MTESEPSTKQRILDATRATLVEHGYDDLSMGKIAEEFDGSQSLLHYHFDSKEELLAAMLRRERRRYDEAFATQFPDDPEQRLDRLVDQFVREYSHWAEQNPMSVRLAELFGAAHHSDPIQRELRAFYGRIREAFVETVREGVEDGTFADVDPEKVGYLLAAANHGAGQQWMVGDESADEVLADALEEYVVSEVKR